jgi:two-component system, chemotaxis family, sensor kinase CheA
MERAGGTSGDNFLAGFLDDYFAECEEHLAGVRRALLALEDSLGDPGTQAVLLDELFRSFHSVKGLSAMVDVREAERLAHELEGYLRRLRDGELALTADSLSILIDSTATLESVIVARRANTPMPPVEGDIKRLAVLTAERGAPHGAVPDRAGEPKETSAQVAWRFTFIPSAALVNRGVKVDTIRARLASIGRITSVAPQVRAGGGIAFEFLVTGPEDESAFEAWRTDGLSWERLDASVVTEAPEFAPDSRAPAPPSSGFSCASI